MGQESMLLFARPSFIEGMGRLVDFAGTMNEYNRSLTGEQADANAFASDWLALRSDFEEAIHQLTKNSDRVKKLPQESAK